MSYRIATTSKIVNILFLCILTCLLIVSHTVMASPPNAVNNGLDIRKSHFLFTPFLSEAVIFYTLDAMSRESTKAYASELANAAEVFINIPATKLSALVSKKTDTSLLCSQQLQFVSTSLHSTIQAMQFKHTFEHDVRFKDFPICINSITWLANNELTCSIVSGRAECDVSPIASKTFVPSYTHLVFFLENGKAYVHDGAMYLDMADSYSVFIHELAHFAGFVDEYAVSSVLAQQYCKQNSVPNLLMSSSEGIKEHEKFALWQQYYTRVRELAPLLDTSLERGENDATVAVDITRTCDELDLVAFKPSTKLTFMEYHDILYIPPIYILMWQDVLQRHHQHVAVSALFRKSAQQASNANAVVYWSQF